MEALLDRKPLQMEYLHNSKRPEASHTSPNAFSIYYYVESSTDLNAEISSY